MVERQIDTELYMNQNSGIVSDLIVSDPDGDTVVHLVVDALAISPEDPTIDEEATEELTVTGTVADNDESRDVTLDCVYSSADESVVTVDGKGVLTGVAPGGPIDVTARYGNVTDIIAVTVDDIYESLAVDPEAPSIEEAGVQQLTITATMKDETTRDVTGECTFESADDEVATVDETGLVTGVAAGGPVNVTATFRELTAVSAVTVTAE